MTIERGVEWGEIIQTPRDVVSIGSDADLGSCGQAVYVSLVGGDLFESLGSPRSVVDQATCRLVNIDALRCVVTRNGSASEVLASSSVVVGKWTSRKQFVCVTNGGLIQGRDVAPRAHPNDGKWDVLRIVESMSVRQRLIARQRSRTGTHIPHPDITVSRVTSVSVENTQQQQRLWIDGVAMGEWSAVHCTVLPDYWRVLL